MDFIESIWNKAKNKYKHIVLPETQDPRILKATELITKSKLAHITLLGDEKEIKKSTKGKKANN